MIIVGVIGIIFILQLFNLQIVHGEEYRQQSENRLVREVKVTAPRGEIYDRYGKIMVTNVTGYNLSIYYTKIEKSELNKALLTLSNILEKNGDEYSNSFPIDFETMTFTKNENSAVAWKKSMKIKEDSTAQEVIEFYKKKYEIENEDINEVKKIIILRYEITSKGYSSFKSVTVAKDISKESMLEIEERGSELPGVIVTTQAVRKYTAGSIASHIAGYIGRISSSEFEKRKDSGYTQNDMIGKSGIEATFEEFLKGTDGIERLEMDSEGRLTGKEETKESKMGNNVILTIDLDLQKKAEEVLEKYINKIQTGKAGTIYKDAKARIYSCS